MAGLDAMWRSKCCQRLFDMRPGGQRSVYDVSSDGQRFLVNTLAEETASAPITLVVNWTALLKK